MSLVCDGMVGREAPAPFRAARFMREMGPR